MPERAECTVVDRKQHQQQLQSLELLRDRLSEARQRRQLALRQQSALLQQTAAAIARLVEGAAFSALSEEERAAIRGLLAAHELVEQAEREIADLDGRVERLTTTPYPW